MLRHMRRLRIILIVGGNLSLLPFLFDTTSLNLVALDTTWALSRDGAKHDVLRFPTLRSSNMDCRVYWFDGLLAQRRNEVAERNRAWTSSMRCSPSAVSLIGAILPTDRTAAETATQLLPGVADGWFWLADIEAADEPSTGIEHYRRGLALRPSADKVWRKLGYLLSRDDPHGALQAFAQECTYAGPWAGGCELAGMMAEKTGEFDLALQYFRHSRLPGSRERAEALEQRLREQR